MFGFRVRTSLLFAGLLINKDKLPASLQWLETFSFFHAAFEALLINEVRYLSLKDHRCVFSPSFLSRSRKPDASSDTYKPFHRYGVDIEVPAATILSLFGFQASVSSLLPPFKMIMSLIDALCAHRLSGSLISPSWLDCLLR